MSRRGFTDAEHASLVLVLHRLDRPGLRRDQHRSRTGLLESLARIGQLDLIDAVGRDDRDLEAVEPSLFHGLTSRRPRRKRGAEGCRRGGYPLGVRVPRGQTDRERSRSRSTSSRRGPER